MNINDLLEITASICPDRKGFVYKNQSITFSELEHKVNELSDVLVNIGIKNGDRIFYFNTNSIDWVTIVFASSKIGAVVVPINYRSKSKELQFMLNDSEPALIFAGNRYHDLIKNNETKKLEKLGAIIFNSQIGQNIEFITSKFNNKVSASCQILVDSRYFR